MVCGCENTPFNVTDTPSGAIFSDAANAAGSTMTVAGGEIVKMIVSGPPGVGWPHPTGHLEAYMAWCGPGPTDCQTFDAALGQCATCRVDRADRVDFKILEARPGLSPG